MRYALYKAGVFQRYQEFDAQPDALSLAKQMEWIEEPVVPPLPPTIDELKLAKRADLNAKRAEMETNGFMYLGYKFDSDQRSADRLQVAAIAAQSSILVGQPFNLEWISADNVAVPLDASGVLGLVGAFASYGLTLHQTVQTLKSQVDAATTKEELDAIVWPV